MENTIYNALQLEVLVGFFSMLKDKKVKNRAFSPRPHGYMRAWKRAFPEHLKFFGPQTELGRENTVDNEADRWKHS